MAPSSNAAVIMPTARWGVWWYLSDSDNFGHYMPRFDAMIFGTYLCNIKIVIYFRALVIWYKGLFLYASGSLPVWATTNLKTDSEARATAHDSQEQTNLASGFLDASWVHMMILSRRMADCLGTQDRRSNHQETATPCLQHSLTATLPWLSKDARREAAIQALWYR